MQTLLLASASKYRQELLSKLGIPFKCQSPALDEEKHKDPSLAPQALAEHLAFLKTQSLAQIYPQMTVIGGDQLVAFGTQILGKAHTVQKAHDQLMQMQGKEHQLITATCVYHQGHFHPWTNITTLKMKPLTSEQIYSYIELDQPLDCAGSYKIEKHGIALFDKIECEDFTAIQGLPLIRLSQMLIGFGFNLFSQ